MTRAEVRSGLVGGLVIVTAFVAVSLTNLGYDLSLRDAQYFNGWVLAIAMACLMTLAGRKRLSTLPLGRVRSWLKVHFYLGLLTVALFVLHAGYRLPEAPLEILIYGLFVLISLSGFFGTLITKVIPARLGSQTEPVIYERIPLLRAELAREAEELALQSVETGQTVSLANLYRKRLAHFFAGPRHLRQHLIQSTSPITKLLQKLDAIERYQDEAGRARLARMRELMIAKSELDFQTANMGLMKTWLFLHVPAAFSLMLFIILHVLIAYAFSAGTL